ncbi:alpha/beta-hydrolase [Collybia nuda]|uniref:Carboxylic ester hydrolase n=1 Tax=Collybia nuda TaxID=64659 RepID=A0A9P5YIF3_9AGAR|nr:alpha/beta-hydrolase [Collybia nuda]
MVALNLLFSSLLLSSAVASPLSSKPLRIPTINPKDVLCQLPIIKKFLCPITGAAALNVQTPIGVARGTADPAGAKRFTVKYASASRWAYSTVASAWNFPNGSPDELVLPLACPQAGVDPSAYTEDCLSMVLYVPPGLTLVSAAPTLMWIHGGSFVVGSATGPGLDGSKLAIATDSIVAVVQYRLGALGFMAPDGKTNLAAKDIVNALQFLKKVLPAFGGSPSKITIAGQSAGANMVRALLAAPSASSLFRSAILQSDPMNYGFLSSTTQQAMQSHFNGLIDCGPSDSSCWNSLSLETILNAQGKLSNDSVAIDPSTGLAQPIRVVRDNQFITSPLDSTAPFPSVNKPILVTSVLHEAGFAIYKGFETPLPQEWLYPVCEATFGSRTDVVLSSPYYPAALGSTDARDQLQLMGTDYLWKCSGWTFARNWVQNGGSAYVAEYAIGASYPGNEAVPFCTEAGKVCHQDDIMIVFGTAANPAPAQSALINQMQKHYKAFLNNGNPNAAGLPTWTPAASPNVQPLRLGGPGQVSVGACDPSFWGQAAQYDYQFYNI